MIAESFCEAMSFFQKIRGSGKPAKSPKAPIGVEISAPCDMRHEIRVGWDDDGVLRGMPESWQRWLQAANIRYFGSCEDRVLAAEF